MNRRLHDLNCSIVADLEGRSVGRERHLWETKGSVVSFSRRSDDLEGRYHRVAHVEGLCARAFSLVAHVEIEKCGCVALEPAGLYGDSTSVQGPLRPILRDRNSST